MAEVGKWAGYGAEIMAVPVETGKVNMKSESLLAT
jgi:hypothetical protein